MHLSVRRNAGMVELNSNPYKGWRYGVSRYDIERFDEDTGVWVKVGEVPGTQQFFADPESDLGRAQNNYRVLAHENNGNRTSSLSNEEGVILDPDFYIANAFTPNNDGINDGFVIEGVFLDQASLVIFNRWGNEVYRSETLDQPWNGLMSNGKPAPEGVYVYFVKGTGYTGMNIQRSGSITLIR
ncbi:MAG: gliding motility-associated C-terminal domain-containing protein, partial [bacterium]|nr:gliding motility-associated C-terminal domain-containing protein [bacterium]